MTRGRIPLITNYKAGDLIHIKTDPYSGNPWSKAASVSSFFAHIPSGVNVGLGATAYTHWGIRQSWSTGSPGAGANCGGMRSSVTVNWDTDNNNDAKGISANVSLMNGTPVGGYPTSDIMAVYGFASNYGTNTELDKILGGSFEARQYGGDVGEIYGVMAQATNLSYVDGATTKITGLYADAYTSEPTDGASLVVGTLYGAELRTFGKTNYATSNSAITTAYGLYSALYCQQKAGSASSIGTAYNIYLTDLRPAGGIDYGTVTTYYGLYIVEPTKATTNYAIYAEGRSHFDQPTNDAALPVIALDQADLSEGFIDYLGTSAASAVGPISSWTAGNTIQGFVRVEINGTAYWMPYYDAPTS